MKTIVMCLISLVSLPGVSQDTATSNIVPAANSLTLGVYVEGYYTYDFNKPIANTRPNFLYNYNRHNEFNQNLGFVKASYNAQRVRANVALAVGTYMNANYAAEPGTLKNIYEANAGYKISAKKNLWFDIGIMPSHIGFETAIGKDNWTLTRSMVAENSPYFESGAKLTYISPNEKFTLSALALNGWQRITRVEGHSLVSFGTQIYYKPSKKVTLNYSTFFGSDKPDSARLFRTYHNVYGIFQITPVVGLIAGFDMGTEEKTATGGSSSVWYTPVGILRIKPNDNWSIALRGEYFSDGNGVIVSLATPNGFKTLGGSLNLDYLPVNNVVFRVEGRYLTSRDDIFIRGGTAKNSNTAITFSTAINF